jgi:hypothetical protein
MKCNAQGYREGSVRPRFLCMVRSRKGQADSIDADRQFQRASGVAATIRFDTPSHEFRLWTTRPEQLAIDRERGVALLLYGQLVDSVPTDQPTWCLQKYLRKGIKCSRDLNGSFVVVVVDAREDRIAVITDRVNTRRAFTSEYAGARWVSNCLYTHPLRGVKLDPIGIAWSLVNKAVYNNRTLFEGVRILERASVHELRSTGFDSHAYWTYRFDHSHEGLRLPELRNELSHLLVDSVRKCMPVDSPVILPLTGGWDSVGILGILRYKLNVAGVESFTWFNTKKPRRNGDADVARAMAEIAGYRHRAARGYTGDVMERIDQDGSFGNGITQPGSEFDALIELSEGFGRCDKSAMLMGAHCFGWVACDLQSNRDLLDRLQLLEWTTAPALVHLFDGATCRRLADGLAADREAILEKHRDVEDYYDLKEVLYLDQRMSNYILPQNEYFFGDFMTVANPFLENAVLDFTMKVPAAWRSGKRLYKLTIAEMLPELFAIRRATRGEFTTDWGRESESRSADIRQMLLSRKSMLDELVPPDRIVEFLKHGVRWKASAKAWMRLQAFAGKAIAKLKGTRPPPRRLITGRAHILRRILALRSFLNKTVDRWI